MTPKLLAAMKLVHELAWGNKLNPDCEDEVDIAEQQESALELVGSFITRFPVLEEPDPREVSYLASFGTKCPNCGSDNLDTSGTVDVDCNGGNQHVECSDCGATWTDEYELTGFRDLEVNEYEDAFMEVVVGDEVFWNDPDNGACSGVYRIVEILTDGGRVLNPTDILKLEGVSGGQVEAFAHELS